METEIQTKGIVSKEKFIQDNKKEQDELKKIHQNLQKYITLE